MLYDYGLRSKAYLRPEERPPQFKSADGRWIRVDKTIAAENRRVTNRGRVRNERVLPCYAACLMRRRPYTRSWNAKLACARRTSSFRRRTSSSSGGASSTCTSLSHTFPLIRVVD